MPDAWLEDLPLEDCLSRLRNREVGRIAVMIDGFPIVVPVNYLLVETAGPPWLALRTRPGNVIDRAPNNVAFEIDNLDPAPGQAWSVLVRGTLLPVDPDAAEFRERFDPQPWLLTDRDAWRVIEPFAITGRQLNAAAVEWTLHPRAHL